MANASVSWLTLVFVGIVARFFLAAFDADQYMQQLMATAPLRKLMDRDDALSREVKALDSDMQTLVYENYNKFIRCGYAGCALVHERTNTYRL